MATIVDVARAAGVSVQTVSAVINEKSGISEATRARIRAIVTELDYQPNQLASSLRSQRTRTVGILVPSITNPYWPEMVRGAEDMAHHNGYAVFLCNTDGDPVKRRTYIQLLRRQRVAGIFSTMGMADADSAGLLTAGIHVALSGDPGAYERMVTLHVDDHQGGYDATTHLLDLGHRRIGIVAPDDTPGAGRRAGYRAALTERGIAPDPDLIVIGEFDVPSGQIGAQRLMALPSPPTAIVAGNDLIAIGAITALKRLGKRVPEDLSVIGFDDIPMAELYDPPLTTIAQPLYEMGAHAMRAILDRIHDPALPGTSTTFATPLIVRRSTATVGELEPRPGAAPGTRTPGTGVGHQPASREELPMK